MQINENLPLPSLGKSWEKVAQNPSWDAFFSSFDRPLSLDEKKHMAYQFFDFASKQIQHLMQQQIKKLKELRYK